MTDAKVIFDAIRAKSGGTLTQKQVNAIDTVIGKAGHTVVADMLGIKPKINWQLSAAGFELIKKALFGGKLNQSQVDGINTILKAVSDFGLTDLRHISYVLATAYHETARTMQPIEEYGKGKGHNYGVAIKGKVYYGRGYVQLTWLSNYVTMGKLLDVNFVDNPALACDPEIAAKIMLEGMTRGMFTGYKLDDYISGSKCDYKNARRIINGIDRASDVAEYATKFEQGLNKP